MSNRIIVAAALSFSMLGHASASSPFAITFEWGNIPKCTSGNPGRVTNPTFYLTGVPAGTTQLRFKLTDQDAPGYNHGGGTVAYSGKGKVSPGLFSYNSPCPPNGKHTYVWAATALDATGKAIAAAKSSQMYP